MTGRAFIVSITTVVVVLGVALCAGPKKPGTGPMKEEARIEYRVRTIFDSARVQQLEAENLRLARVAASQIGRAKKSDSLASEFRETADSLATAAYRAAKVEERAQLWEASAHTFRDEADAATMASLAKDSALVVRDTQIMKRDTIISTITARAARAESRVAALEPLAAKADDCKIVGFISCPTRKQSFVAGGLLSIGALLAARR
jgi:hypothetical protein